MAFSPQANQTIMDQTNQVMASLMARGTPPAEQPRNDHELQKQLIELKEKLEMRGTLPAEPYISPEIRAMMNKGGRKRKQKRKTRGKPKTKGRKSKKN